MTLQKLTEILSQAQEIYIPDIEVEVESSIYTEDISRGIINGVIFREESITLEMFGSD